MSNRTSRIYPEMELRTYTEDFIVRVVHATWVRVKRGDVRTLVYTELTHRMENDIENSHLRAATTLHEYFKLNQNFHEHCERIKYLYVVGSGDSDVEKPDIDHLSDKERFLLRFKP